MRCVNLQGTLIFGGIPKDTKKPTNSQYFVYELVG